MSGLPGAADSNSIHRDAPFAGPKLNADLHVAYTIEELWTDFFESLQDTELDLLDEIGLEFVTPEVAILQTRIAFTNLKRAKSRPGEIFAGEQKAHSRCRQ
jgi:hypothetical protein